MLVLAGVMHRFVRCAGTVCLRVRACRPWRRRARRAPARQGAAGRPPEVGAVPARPVRLFALFPRQLARLFDAPAY